MPDLDAVKAWLGLEAADVQDDALLQTSLDAAIYSQGLVVTYPYTDASLTVLTCPADLYEAALLRTQRLAARRNSPEGVVGLSGTGGDFVGARVPTGDPDVLRLEGPWLRVDGIA
jgi:hypothetical protein